MLRRPRPALLLALMGLLALAVTGVLAKAIPATEEGDAHSLQGFVGLNRPRLTPVVDHIAHLADPFPYALVGLALTCLALARGRVRVAVAIPLLFVVTGVTTRTLKVLLASPRVDDWFGGAYIAPESWPSGHSTAAMTVALCAVIASPARLRPTVAALGGGFAVAVGYSILTLAWHFPSDVFGGYLVAGTWVLLALAALAALEQWRPAHVRAEAPPRPIDVLPALGLGALAAGTVLGIAIARPRALLDYAQAHTTFAVGAVGIAALAVVLATLLGLGFRGGPRPAPVAPRRSA